MLEKVQSDVPNPIIFRNITPDSVGEGICYVRGGAQRVSKIDRPYIVLTLQDLEGNVIPGYIFNLDDAKQSGLDLTRIERNLVQIKYTENYLPRQGLTILINKVELVKNPSVEMLTQYVGSLREVDEEYNKLRAGLVEELSIRINISRSICQQYHIDYNNGKVGGLVSHYWDMFKALQVLGDRLPTQDRKTLFGNFVIFIYTHSQYLKVSGNDKADIAFVSLLTKNVQTYTSALELGSGALEIIHSFFGYEPQDVFVRAIFNISDTVQRQCKEFSLWRSLPISRKGDAGYGVIKRYQ